MELKEYFQSYENYFWQWETDADVPDNSGYQENNLITIPNVGSIAYRPYIMEVLKELQPQGLPPFGSLLLALYATESGFDNLKDVFYHIVKHNQFNIIGSYKAKVFLQKLIRLDTAYKKGQNRVILLKTIFKDTHNLVSTGNSKFILDRFQKRPYKIGESANKTGLTASVILKDITVLALLNDKFPTTEAIIEAMKNIGVEPELEEEVVEEETTVETDKDFIQELIEEPKTFQVGSLIKRIWSGLKIPMHHLSPGEQPIGGISDMTNKGDLSRMLLSEFANEDEVFMSRIANNEALYIQREIPPEENIFERIILIDTSLRNWGTPKVLAFASTLAIIKHPKANTECKVFTVGKSYQSTSLDKVTEVIENLNQVSSALDVSETLEHFFVEYTDKDLEVFFITHQQNIEQTALQKVIHENRDRLKFLITTDAEGELNFYKHHKGTRKHIQKIKLPLQELWANPPKTRRKQPITNSSKNQGKATDLPLNYPLLFPTPKNKIATFLHEGEFYILSSKKQLLRTYLSNNYYEQRYYERHKIHRGCEVLIENISVKPKGQFALAKNKQGNYILCQYQDDKKLLSKLNLNTKEYSELNLTGQKIPVSVTLIYFSKSFYLYNDSSAEMHKIAIEGPASIEKVKKDPEIEINDKKVAKELDKLNGNSGHIFNNFHQIGINKKGNLQISNYQIEKGYENSLTFSKCFQEISYLAERNKNKFLFNDNSEIMVDNRGMLTFTSSDKNIPVFYIPSSEKGFLAIATTHEYGGSEYYLPEENKFKMRKMEDMYEDYVMPFIENIMSYGA